MKTIKRMTMVAAMLPLAVLIVGAAQAADMYGLIAGTTNKWNTTDTNWSTTFGGPYNTTWVQGSGAILTNGSTGALGAFTVGAPVTLTKLVFGGGVGGTATISASGGGTWTFSGAPSYLIDNSQAGANNPEVFVPIYADTGTVYFRQRSANNALSLNVSNNFAGAVHIAQGRITLKHANALTGTSGVIVSNTAVLGIWGVKVSDVTVALNGIGGGGNGGSALQQGGDTAGGEWAGNVLLNTDSSIGNRGVMIAQPFVISGTISEIGGARSLLINSAATGSGGGAYGKGVVKLSGANTYSGITTLRAGTLLLGTNAPSGADGALGRATSALALGDTTVNGTHVLKVLTDGAYTVGRDISVNKYGVFSVIAVGGNQSSGTSTYTGTITLNTNVTLQALTGSEVDFTTGKITGSGGVGTDGGGTLLLSGANDYSGGSVLTNILLLSDNASALGSGQVNLLTNSTLQLQQALTISNLSGTAGAYVNLNGNTLTVNQGGASSFAGAITNNGNLAKGGAGQLTLAGNNSYKGDTAIQEGTLRLGINNALPADSALTLNAGSTLDMNGYSSSAQSLSGTGKLTVSTNSTLALTGALTASLEVVLDSAGFDPYKKYDIVTCTGTPSGTYTCATKPWLLVASDGKLTLCQIRGTMIRFL
jgi:autotransporter-associated beta strand protein